MYRITQLVIISLAAVVAIGCGTSESDSKGDQTDGSQTAVSASQDAEDTKSAERPETIESDRFYRLVKGEVTRSDFLKSNPNAKKNPHQTKNSLKIVVLDDPLIKYFFFDDRLFELSYQIPRTSETMEKEFSRLTQMLGQPRSTEISAEWRENGVSRVAEWYIPETKVSIRLRYTPIQLGAVNGVLDVNYLNAGGQDSVVRFLRQQNRLSEIASPSNAELPFDLNDFKRVLGKPDEESSASVLYRNKMQISEREGQITIAFATSSEGLLFAAGLFTSDLFPRYESDEIIECLDRIGQTQRIGRFQVGVGRAKQPYGWRLVTFSKIQG